jgi:hypothetical protein
MPTQSRQLAAFMFTDTDVMLNMNIGYSDFVLMVALALHPFAVKILGHASLPLIILTPIGSLL